MRQTEVDGVPTLITPTSGPMHAGLVFRVGIADETLATSGITHLVEHLVLHAHGLTDHHSNGSIGAVVTGFQMQGSEEAVVTFLTGVCTGLKDLPLDRFELEKEILRTEETSRTSKVNQTAPLWRHGARDFGLLSYPEWGLFRLTTDDLRQWTESWFTRENAVLWIAGDGVPAGLRLPLPEGSRRPVGVPSSALSVTPAYFTGSPHAVLLDSVVSRRTAASVYASVLERELFRALRQEGGYSYTASTSYDPRGDGFATIVAVADALPEKQGAVLGGFIDVLMKLKVGRVEQADLDSVVAKAEEALRHPEADVARLPVAAFNLLTGYPNRTIEEDRDEVRAVTGADVHEVAVEVMDSALLMAPEGHRADWAGFHAAPDYSTTAVTGHRYQSLEHDGLSLVIGAEGASQITAPGPVTVRYDQCVAALAWADGARRLIGQDALVLHIEPTMFAVDAAAMASIDAALDPAIVVPMPDRRPESIPRPTPRPAPPVLSAAKPAGAGWFEMATLATLIVFTTIMIFSALFCTLGVAVDQKSDGWEWFIIGVVWCFVTVLVLPVIALTRRRRQQR